MTNTDPTALAAHLPADAVPFGGDKEPWLINTYVAVGPEVPPEGKNINIHLARGTTGINLGRYSWRFDEAERLALAILAACKSGREWRASVDQLAEPQP
jgi:hypothetical protein